MSAAATKRIMLTMIFHESKGLIAALVFVLAPSVVSAQPEVGSPPDQKQEVRYLRRTEKGLVPECTFVLLRNPNGWSIHSRTGQGARALTVSAEYDAQDRLVAGRVVTGQKEERAVHIKADGTKVRTEMRGKVLEFDVPPGVIVTSAPDWTDVFLLCRRYDRQKGGQQRFPGLWVHPEQGAFQLTFTVERTGAEKIKLGEKQKELDRFLLRLRNNSEYTAWVDDQGTMIRLQPKAQSKPAYELVLEGHEK